MRKACSTGPASWATTFDPAALEGRLAELEERMGAPDFWDDAATAARVSADHAAVRDRLEEYRGLTSELADLGELAELARAEGCLLYTSPSPRDRTRSRMPSSA